MPKFRNPKAAYWIALEQREREIITETLTVTRGRRSAAAALLGIDRSFMVKRMRHLGLDKKVAAAKPHWLLEKEPA